MFRTYLLLLVFIFVPFSSFPWSSLVWAQTGCHTHTHTHTQTRGNRLKGQKRNILGKVLHSEKSHTAAVQNINRDYLLLSLITMQHFIQNFYLFVLFLNPTHSYNRVIRNVTNMLTVNMTSYHHRKHQSLKTAARFDTTFVLCCSLACSKNINNVQCWQSGGNIIGFKITTVITKPLLGSIFNAVVVMGTKGTTCPPPQNSCADTLSTPRL